MIEEKEHTSPFTLIAGPCSAESREQVWETAQGVKEAGVRIFRAGIWKPRSRANHFEGVGAEGLRWLDEVRRTLGMQVTTEVATTAHVEQAMKANVDMLWIGARTTVNPFQVQEIAEALQGADVPVLVKNPLAPDYELWIGAVERLVCAGVKNIAAIHRGFHLLDNAPYRNFPLWELMERFRKHFPDIPMLCDPSHISGQRGLVEGVCREALSYRVDGLFIEAHYRPDEALSDKQQQITPKELGEMLGGFRLL